MSLTLRVEWDRLSKLVSGFLEARQFYLNGSGKGTFTHGRHQLVATSKTIIKGLETFLRRHKTMLPEEATKSLENFLGGAWDSVLPDAWDMSTMEDRFLALASIRSVLDFHLADFELFARRLSDRAFSHLKRSIVVDEEVKSKWQRAYRSKGETACEGLGAVHLLAHGIWAFKAYSPGERTDLVMGERLVDLSEIERASEVLVLTEWKKVGRGNALGACAEKAFKQASRYGSGSLAGIELGAHRYLVLVSEDVLVKPSNRTVGGITYEYVNIPVNPLPPSRTKAASRKGPAGERTTRASSGHLGLRPGAR